MAVAAGKTKSLALRVSPNLVSLSAGATVVSASNEDEGLPAKFLLDDTAASVWSTKKGAGAYNAGPDQRVTVKLAEPATINRIQVSAFKNTTGSRFAALKDFTFQVSSDGWPRDVQQVARQLHRQADRNQLVNDAARPIGRGICH